MVAGSCCGTNASDGRLRMLEMSKHVLSQFCDVGCVAGPSGVGSWATSGSGPESPSPATIPLNLDIIDDCGIAGPQSGSSLHVLGVYPPYILPLS
mgnify:CR=1 FL=1